MQDELCELEEKLRAVDEDDVGAGAEGLWNLHSRREDQNLDRAAIVQEVREKLRIYRMSNTTEVFCGNK